MIKSNCRPSNRTNFSFIKLIPILAFLLICHSSISAQTCDELVCNGELQISLNAACELSLTPDMLLEAPEPGDYEITVYDDDGDFLRMGVLNGSDAGTTVKYKISCGSNSCWGQIIVEANIIPMLASPCEAREDGSIPSDCTLWCSPSGVIPSTLVTPAEAEAAFGDCGPELLGDLVVRETRTGDICSDGGEIVVLKYSGKVLMHGSIRNVDILTQRYTTLPLDVETLRFPIDVDLNCDYVENIRLPEGAAPVNYEFGSPLSVYKSTKSVRTAFPHFVDTHDTILNIIEVYDTIPVVVDQMLRDTMIKEVINGQELWVLKTIVDKVFIDSISITLDTIGKTNPVVPIIDRVCNVLVSYKDIEFDACGQGKKIIREWTMIDWCDADISRTERQVIEIKDLSAPFVVERINGQFVPVSRLSDVTASVEPWTCAAKVKLPTLNIIDNCDPDVSVSWYTDEGIVKDGYLTDLWYDQGPIEVIGTVTDECGNSTDVRFNVVVVDDVPPVPVCEAGLSVTLTGSEDDFGVAKVYAEALNEGSHDSGCGKVTVQVIRMEDWQDVVRDCNDNIVGYQPVSCDPITELVNLGQTDRKGRCTFDPSNKENFGEVAVAGDYVKFCCEDAGQIVTVVLIVTDEAGNSNQCMIDINVQDKSRPALICEDRVIDCTDGDPLEVPGMIGGTCEGERSYDVLLLNEQKGPNVCAGGQVIREWYVDNDASGDFNTGDAYCRQVISVRADAKFDPYTIKWPKHYDDGAIDGINLECNSDGKQIETQTVVSMGPAAACMPDEVSDEPVWCDTDCGLVGYSMEQDTVRASDACLKIIQRWTIVDWCTYDANGSDIDDENDSARDRFQAVEDWAQGECASCPEFGPVADPVYFRYTDVDEDGYYTFDQVIKVIDDTAPTIEGPAEYTVNTAGGATTKDDNTPCTGSDVITASASDFCGGEMTGSNLLQWIITVSKNGEVVATKTVKGPEASMDSQVGSPGDEHIITWRVKDGCGNESSARTTVSFGDEKAPTPFCITGLTTKFMETTGMIAVWGKEFDFGSFDNCTATEDLRFTIVATGEAPIRPGEAGFDDQNGITFSCNDFTSFEELDVWVWDADGNGDFCSVGILLGDNDITCPEPNGEEPEEEEEGEEEEEVEEEENDGAGVMIAGQVQTGYGTMISNVEVTASTNLKEYPKQSMTDGNGAYAFENNPLENNYKLTAAKDDTYLNGVSTLDLVFISQHIVSSIEFDNAYDVIASDVSGDGRVSALDLTELKRLILGVTDQLANVAPWTFIKKDQVFFDELNPWPLVLDNTILDLSNNMMSESFIGVKMGDVNQSASINGLQAAEIRSDKLITFNIENQRLVKGDKVNVELSSNDFTNVFGYQMTLHHLGLRLTDVSSGSITIDGTSINSMEELLTMSWYEPTAQTATEGDMLFTLTFEATQDLELKESIFISSEMTASEAYVGPYYETIGVGVAFSNDISESIELFQNTPNPFSSATRLGFNLPEGGQATVTIFDIAGKQLHVINGQYTKGYNEIELMKTDLAGSGILYYQLISGDYQTTKKMILID